MMLKGMYNMWRALYVNNHVFRFAPSLYLMFPCQIDVSKAPLTCYTDIWTKTRTRKCDRTDGQSWNFLYAHEKVAAVNNNTFRLAHSPSWCSLVEIDTGRPRSFIHAIWTKTWTPKIQSYRWTVLKSLSLTAMRFVQTNHSCTVRVCVESYWRSSNPFANHCNTNSSYF